MTKQVTSAGANKMLKALNEKVKFLRDKERRDAVYSEIDGIEPIVPSDYNFEETRDQIAFINKQIVALKHGINKFNLETKVPGFEYTIDQALVVMKQLSDERDRLDDMRAKQRKSLKTSFSGRSGPPEYEVLNYDLDSAALRYEAVCEELVKLQLALDNVNSNLTFLYDDGVEQSAE